MLGISAAQAVLFFTSNGKVYFQPSIQICGEEMALEATLQPYGIDFSSHASPFPVVLLGDNQLLIFYLTFPSFTLSIFPHPQALWVISFLPLDQS